MGKDTYIMLGTKQPTWGNAPLPIEVKIGSVLASTDPKVFTDANVKAATACYKLEDLILQPDSRKTDNLIASNILQHSLVALIFDNAVVAGFIIAKVFELEAFVGSAICQTFYSSNLQGVKSVKAVWAAHRVMIEYGKSKGLESAVSTCSFKDENNMLSKILELDGWRRQGHTAVFDIGGKT